MISCFPRSSYSRISRKMPGRHHHSLVAFLIWCLTASTHAVELTSRRDDGVYFQITPIGQPFCNKPARVLFPNGDAYEGEMTNDKKHGQGKLISPNGAAYEGEWKDDKREGEQKPPHLAPLLLLLLRARGADARTRPQASASTRTRPVTRTRGSGRRARRLGPARTTARVPHPRLPASGWTARSGWPTGSSPTARGSAAPSAATAGRRASAAS